MFYKVLFKFLAHAIVEMTKESDMADNSGFKVHLIQDYSMLDTLSKSVGEKTDLLLQHSKLLTNLTKIRFNKFGWEWSYHDICHRFSETPKLDLGEMNGIVMPYVDRTIPCLVSTPLDCFWDGSKHLGPDPPIVIPEMVEYFFDNLPDGPISWKNLNPSSLFGTIAELIDIEEVTKYYEKAGIGNAYQDRSCLNPLDKNCPKTAPNKVKICDLVEDLVTWNVENGNPLKLDELPSTTTIPKTTETAETTESEQSSTPTVNVIDETVEIPEKDLNVGILGAVPVGDQDPALAGPDDVDDEIISTTTPAGDNLSTKTTRSQSTTTAAEGLGKDDSIPYPEYFVDDDDKDENTTTTTSNPSENASTEGSDETTERRNRRVKRQFDFGDFTGGDSDEESPEDLLRSILNPSSVKKADNNEDIPAYDEDDPNASYTCRFYRSAVMKWIYSNRQSLPEVFKERLSPSSVAQMGIDCPSWAPNMFTWKSGQMFQPNDRTFTSKLFLLNKYQLKHRFNPHGKYLQSNMVRPVRNITTSEASEIVEEFKRVIETIVKDSESVYEEIHPIPFTSFKNDKKFFD